MNKPTIFPDDLAAMAKINEGLRMLQEAKANAPQSAPGTVSDQLAQQGIAALQGPQAPQEQPEEMGQAVQTSAPQTPTGQMAMQANVGAQIQQQQQQQQQQQGQQAAMQLAQQQKPQGMAHGGIAALRSDNMRHFKEGGVLGFQGIGDQGQKVPKPEAEEKSLYERIPEESGLKKLLRFLSKREEDIAAREKTRYPVAKPPVETEKKSLPEDLITRPIDFGVGEGFPESPSPLETRPIDFGVGKGFGGEPSAQPGASSNRGLGQLQQLQKQMADDKAQALALADATERPKVKTLPEIRATQESEAKAMGVDLYGAKQEARVAGLEQEFAKQEAARNEANKGRGMDNLITMLTNTKGSPSFFGSLAHGVNTAQAAEKQQRAEDAAFGGKKLEFMEAINTKRDLMNDRNKALLMGNIAEVTRLNEALRDANNGVLKVKSDIFKESMKEGNQRLISASDNATKMAVENMRTAAHNESMKADREAKDFNQIQSRIAENEKIKNAAVKVKTDQFIKTNPYYLMYNTGNLQGKEREEFINGPLKKHELEIKQEEDYYDKMNANLMKVQESLAGSRVAPALAASRATRVKLADMPDATKG